MNTGFTALFIGNELTDPLNLDLGGHAANAGFPDHLTTSFLAAGDLGAPQAFWEDSTERAAIQAELDAGETELFGMTYSAAFPSVDGYRN